LDLRTFGQGISFIDESMSKTISIVLSFSFEKLKLHFLGIASFAATRPFFLNNLIS
jgi:hypothetical protein